MNMGVKQDAGAALLAGAVWLLCFAFLPEENPIRLVVGGLAAIVGIGYAGIAGWKLLKSEPSAPPSE